MANIAIHVVEITTEDKIMQVNEKRRENEPSGIPSSLDRWKEITLQGFYINFPETKAQS
jgi:hypothetical protein